MIGIFYMMRSVYIQKQKKTMFIFRPGRGGVGCVLFLFLVFFMGEACCKAASIEEISHEFFSRVDLDRPELSAVKTAYLSGSYGAALDGYRDIFVDRMSGLNLGSAEGFWSQGATSASMAYTGTIKMDAMGTGYCTYTIGVPGSVQWFPLVDCYIDFGRDVSSMHWTGIIVKAYLEGQSQSYLERFCDYWNDFATNWMDARPSNGYPYSDTLHWAWKSGLYLAWRTDNFMRFYCAACRYSPMQAKASISGAELAAILIQLTTLEIPDLAGFRYPATPNQQVLAIQALLKASAALEDFQDVDTWRQFALAKAQEYVTAGNYLADGSDQEQSFNYNAGLIDSAQQMIDLIDEIFPDDEQAQAIVDKLSEAKLYRTRFLEQLKSPIGSTPATGTSSMTVPTDYSAVSYANFDSIYFPYGGYTVLRSGWDRLARYLFFKSSRIGYGHYVEDGLHLTLCAYGKNLLIAGGPNSYSGEPADVYYRSSFSRNTIAVDGCGQTSRSGNQLPANGYPDPIQARWHHSGYFDFVEGFYPYGYGDKITDVTHDRTVLHVRNAGLFIVTDRLRTGDSHLYNLTWGFDSAFAGSDVQYDPANQRLYTAKSGHPNLMLQHFTDADLALEMYHGDSSVSSPDAVGVDWLGWYTPVSGHSNNIAKVDAHLRWNGSGPQQIVSLLYPQSGTAFDVNALVSHGNGFDLTLGSGARISFRAALAGQSLTAGGVSVTGEMLAVVDVSGEPLRGVVIGCAGQEVQIDGQTRPSGCEDFEFRWDSGSLHIVKIQAPGQFRWQGEGDQIYPVYRPVAPEPVTTGDFNADGKVHFVDYSRISSAWMHEYNPGDPDPDVIIADLCTDGRIDVSDLALFCQKWLKISPYLWWAFTGDDVSQVQDWGSLGLPGQFAGSPSWTTNSPASSRAVVLDGAEDFVFADSFDTLTGGQERTISVWIKTDRCGPIAGWGDESGDGQAFALVVQDEYGLAGTLGVLSGTGYKIGRTDLRDNQWHHVAVVLPDDGSADVWEAKLYVDGSEERYSAFRSHPVNTSAGSLRLGADWQGSCYFTGAMDEFKIFRAALSPLSVAELME